MSRGPSLCPGRPLASVVRMARGWYQWIWLGCWQGPTQVLYLTVVSCVLGHPSSCRRFCGPFSSHEDLLSCFRSRSVLGTVTSSIFPQSQRPHLAGRFHVPFPQRMQCVRVLACGWGHDRDSCRFTRLVCQSAPSEGSFTCCGAEFLPDWLIEVHTSDCSFIRSKVFIAYLACARPLADFIRGQNGQNQLVLMELKF